MMFIEFDHKSSIEDRCTVMFQSGGLNVLFGLECWNWVAYFSCGLIRAQIGYKLGFVYAGDCF